MHAPIQAINQAALGSARRLIILIPDYRQLDSIQLGKDIRIRTKGVFLTPIVQALALKGNIPIYQFFNNSH